MAKPLVFIGSSSEALEAARAVRGLLSRDATCTLWNEGLFAIGEGFLESLLKRLDDFDFAILIATPDDAVKSRQRSELAPRDNVLFELGLFMGKLGRRRTFLVRPDNVPIKIPSDFAGVTHAGFDWPAPTDDDARHELRQSDFKDLLGASCDEIRDRIRDLGAKEKNVDVHREIENVQQVAREQEARLQDQEQKLNQLVIYSMAHTIYKHLWGIHEARRNKQTYFYRHNLAFQREMYYLRDHGYIATIGGGFPDFDEGRDGGDMAQDLSLTPAGEFLTELRGPAY